MFYLYNHVNSVMLKCFICFVVLFIVTREYAYTITPVFYVSEYKNRSINETEFDMDFARNF